MSSTIQAEAMSIINGFASGLPEVIDGRAAISEMREGGSRHWKQMEWIGFYPEFWFEQNLAGPLGMSTGPTFGNITFDLAGDGVWDLKSHSSSASPWSPLNDVEAVEECIQTHGGVGFILVSGPCTYDEDGSFKAWHDALKGKKSPYQEKNEALGVKSRRRKTSFAPHEFLAFGFNSMDSLALAHRNGWIKGFQEGMKNSNGTKRRAKIMVDTMSIPDSAIIARNVRHTRSRP